MSKVYESAGVNLDAGYESVERIKAHVARTNRAGIFAALGGFGGMFDLSALDYQQPVLVSGTDGVGTKLLLAIAADRHDTIGVDAVAMCVNDIVVQGAEPLYFLDYIATGKVTPSQIEAIVSGVADGCEQAGAALIGGETAEMPDMYAPGHYDLAGFAVGVVEKDRIITGEKVQPGDVIIGLPSSGLHSNGFSLVRKILLKDNQVSLAEYDERLGEPVIDAVMRPTKIYVKPILALLKQIQPHGLAHITGGGFDENIPRALPKGCQAIINLDSFPKPRVFDYLQHLGDIPAREMYNIFNMGIGMVIIVAANDVPTAMQALTDAGETPYVIGEVSAGDRTQVVLRNAGG